MLVTAIELAQSEGTLIGREDLRAIVTAPGFDAYGKTRYYTVSPANSDGSVLTVGVVKSEYHLDRATEGTVFYAKTNDGRILVSRA